MAHEKGIAQSGADQRRPTKPTGPLLKPKPFEASAFIKHQAPPFKVRQRRDCKKANSASIPVDEYDDEVGSRPQPQSASVSQTFELIAHALAKDYELADETSSEQVYLRCQLQSLQRRFTSDEPGFSHSEVHPLLAYIFYSRAFPDSPFDELRESACKALFRKPAVYTAIFDDLIPKDMRSALVQKCAVSAFDNNQNDLALDDWTIYRERLEDYRNRPTGLTGVSTGLKELDRATNGLEGLTLFGGDRGIGKSALALFMATHAIRQSKDVSAIYYSLDMPKVKQYERLSCMESGLTYRELKACSLGAKEQNAIAQADLRLSENVLPRLRVVSGRPFDQRESGLGSQIIEDIQRLQKKTGTHRTLIVIDLLKDLPIFQDSLPGEDPDCYRLEQLGQVQEAALCSLFPDLSF